jgi:hypothetical protein
VKRRGRRGGVETKTAKEKLDNKREQADKRKQRREIEETVKRRSPEKEKKTFR